MKTLVIVTCGKQKIWEKHPEMGAVKAADAYSSPYFRAKKKLALATRCDWMILSAKYGFLSPDTKIENYDVTFDSKQHISDAALSQQVKEKHLDIYSRVIVIGAKIYYEYVKKAFKEVNCQFSFPLKETIGKNNKKIPELINKITASGNIDDIL